MSIPSSPSLHVAKFGGTSVGILERLLKSAEIVNQNRSIRVVVVSALSGTTNHLIQLWKNIEDSKLSLSILEAIKKRHYDYLQELKASTVAIDGVDHLFSELENLLAQPHASSHSLALGDEILSFGERLGSIFMREAILQKSHGLLKSEDVVIFDVRQIMKTNGDFGEATPDMHLIEEETKSKLLPLINEKKSLIITQGFIGSNSEGKTTTLGRGGSDYSAAILARALRAFELQIWTDVEGVYTFDPRLIPTANTIKEMSYQEAAELAFWGAKVLHPLTLIPTFELGIPVYVGDSLKGGREGTLVTKDLKQAVSIRAVTMRTNQVVVTLSRIKKPQQYGYLAPIFSLLARYRISIDHVTTSEISTSFTLQNPHLLTEEVIKELEHYADINIEGNLALISLIGPMITQDTKLFVEIVNHLKEFHLRSLFMGASQSSLSLLVPTDEAQTIITKIHNHFFVS